jgi:hypothetical protein
MSPAVRALRSDVMRRAASRGGTLRCAEAHALPTLMSISPTRLVDHANWLVARRLQDSAAVVDVTKAVMVGFGAPAVAAFFGAIERDGDLRSSSESYAPHRSKRAADVSVGSDSDLGPRLSLVRSSLNNGHAGAAPSCPFSAMNGNGPSTNYEAAVERA